MAAKWEVWNVHKDGLTHREMYKGDLIEIPAGKYILMDYDEAVQFKSQFFKFEKDAMDQQKPSTYKMIVLKKHLGDSSEHEANKFICHMDGKEFQSQQALDQYVKENFSGQEIVDDVAENEMPEAKRTRKRKE